MSESRNEQRNATVESRFAGIARLWSHGVLLLQAVLKLKAVWRDGTSHHVRRQDGWICCRRLEM